MGLLQDYQSRIESGALKPDLAQVQVMNALADLAERLATGGKHRFLKSLLGNKRIPMRGLYIHGEVGRGKTMLMDLFFASVPLKEKRRVHFHAFMQDIHRERALQRSITEIASDIAADVRLLCLDEMQIVDIADAMIMERLHDGLIAAGTVLVTTANVPPDGLYKDGLNRQNILPFLAKLKETMNVISLDSPKDYRLGRMLARRTYLAPPSAENRVAFNEIWRDLADGAQGIAERIPVVGRVLTVPKAAHGCASFTFYELCGEPLGPPDYLAIAKTYRTVFISGVPKLEAHQRNETKRFILMIDTFYDAGTRVVILAEAAPEALFPQNQHAFESKRTVSRLEEMQSASWWGSKITET